MKGHFHSDAVHFIITAAGVAVVFQVWRMIAGRIASNDNEQVANVGKAAGALVSFPAQ